ncbi:MAG: hypothetical protein DRR16_20840 [Candidatus Parabeggiatoa sp. nov. 3]|nr:MAG: hypothetical protein DRR00_06160 [Gammaproteobacteria bacterium]RKZ68125.1 MAG: hypothetical protein DRQ99_04760 [Gammaproteobacteria bacterium]RKZ81964.1 MAG: hypothetical protein DRR16_20840 [Gammaproteobacteria bacterium]
MAKELYVGKILTNDMITVGKQLVQRLEDTIPISDSFWFYVSEEESWRLFIVSPRVLTEGPKTVCHRVVNTLNADNDDEYALSFFNVSVTDEHYPYVSLLRNVRLSDKLFDSRLTGVGVNGSGYIEDAYIYRLYANAEYSHSQSAVINEEKAAVMA